MELNYLIPMVQNILDDSLLPVAESLIISNDNVELTQTGLQSLNISDCYHDSISNSRPEHFQLFLSYKKYSRTTIYGSARAGEQSNTLQFLTHNSIATLP